MEDSSVIRLAHILAVQAEIEGMKACNIVGIQREITPSYGEEHFFEKAEELRNIAFCHVDQLN